MKGMTASKWLASRDVKFRGEAAIMLSRLQAAAGDSKTTVDKHAIIGLGQGSDGYPKIALAVRKDGLRLYANIHVLAKHQSALGKKLTGKSCVTLKRAADLDDKLLARIVQGSLAAAGLCEE
jgi:hypothetical protein